MTRIGLFSDTHGFLDSKILNFFKECDEIWHAGDIGNIQLEEYFSSKAIIRAVYGNMDSGRNRIKYPEIQRYNCEDVDVLMIHIGGYPKKYNKSILKILEVNPPKLFICGHSHILKVMYDEKYQMLTINPGAAGRSGLHHVRTAVRFEINKKDIQNLEILELSRR